MKPKWDRYAIDSDHFEVDVRRDVDEDGVPFLDIMAVGEQIAVVPQAGNRIRVYSRDSLRS